MFSAVIIPLIFHNPEVTALELGHALVQRAWALVVYQYWFVWSGLCTPFYLVPRWGVDGAFLGMGFSGLHLSIVSHGYSPLSSPDRLWRGPTCVPLSVLKSLFRDFSFPWLRANRFSCTTCCLLRFFGMRSSPPHLRTASTSWGGVCLGDTEPISERQACHWFVDLVHAVQVRNGCAPSGSPILEMAQ